MNDPKKDAPPPASSRTDAPPPPPPSGAPELVDPANPGAGVKVSKKARAHKPDETAPGGRYVVDAQFDPETGETVAGRVVNAQGETLEAIGETELTDDEAAKAKERSEAQRKAAGKGKT